MQLVAEAGTKRYCGTYPIRSRMQRRLKSVEEIQLIQALDRALGALRRDRSGLLYKRMNENVFSNEVFILSLVTTC